MRVSFFGTRIKRNETHIFFLVNTRDMSAPKVLAGVRRLGKEAYQYKFTSKFEYITLECSGTWRPTMLKVVWFRNHRKVESIPVKWVVTDDRGPNGAVGKAKFNPAFSVGLVVTLYKDKLKETFQGKEYKYYIQDEGEKGTKILASFTMDLRVYVSPLDVGENSEALEMTFHNQSRKVQNIVLGMTLTAELLKKGNAIDYDMQSTFSAMTNEVGSQHIDSDDSEMDEEEVVEREGDNRGRYEDPHGKGPPTVVMQAPTPDPTVGSRVPFVAHSVSPYNSHSPSPIHSGHCSSASPTPSPNRSHSPSPDPPSGLHRKEKPKKEKKKKKRGFFKRAPSVESGLEQDDREENPVSPTIPVSPPNAFADSVHRPWEEINEMLKNLQKSVVNLEQENKKLKASMEIQGWLYKRGVRGITANVWRRRFFRVQGSRIYYYKSICTPQPQGFIDIDLVLGVQEVCSEEQDKNCATFIVRCEGRTFQLQAIDELTMKKWMRAIEFLVEFRQKTSQEVNREIFETSHEEQTTS